MTWWCNGTRTTGDHKGPPRAAPPPSPLRSIQFHFVRLMRIGRPQGPTHRILSPLAPTIQRIGPPRPCMVGAFVVAHPCPPPHLFSLFERYWATNAGCRPEQEDILIKSLSK